MEDADQLLSKHYLPRFGITPSGDRRENFYGQLWARDFAVAASNYFAYANPQAVIDSLETLFAYQREDGSLPYRVEREYSGVRILVPVSGSWRLAKPLFELIEGKGKRNQVPRYEGEFNGAEDTVPALILASWQLFRASKEGREYVSVNFEKLEKATSHFRTKLNTETWLVTVTRFNPDWTETIQRHGTLGFINVIWAYSLRAMAEMAKDLGKIEEAARYANEYARVESSIREVLLAPEGFIRAKAGEDRVDSAASVLAGLFLLSPEEAVHMETVLDARVRHTSGLVNFAPRHPRSAVWLVPRIFNPEYHTGYVWPWVTAQNIRTFIRIAREHPEGATRTCYKERAVQEFARLTDLFKKIGGAYEIVLPDTARSARTLFYHPPKNFLASLATYQGVHRELQTLTPTPEPIRSNIILKLDEMLI